MQEEFNKNLENSAPFVELSDEVSELKKGQDEIKSTLKEEMKSQEEFESFVQEEFDKGSRKFDKLESEMETMKEDYKKGVKEIVDTINNKELRELKEEVRDAKEDKKLKKEFFMGVTKTVLSGVIAAMVLYALSKIGLTAP